MVRPMTEGSDPKRRFHRPSLSMATGGGAGLLFVVVEVAAGEGWSPRTRVSAGLIGLPVSCSGSPAAGKGVGGEADGAELFKGVVLVAPVDEVEHRGAEAGQVQLVVLLGDLDEGGGISEGQRIG